MRRVYMNDIIRADKWKKKYPYLIIHTDFSGLSGSVKAKDKQNLIMFFSMSFNKNGKERRVPTMDEACEWVVKEYTERNSEWKDMKYHCKMPSFNML